MTSDPGYVIVGAGVCGLRLAASLAGDGHRVTVLEALRRVGGRIHSVIAPFTMPVEMGAEFVHGESPITQALLREAGGRTCSNDGEMFELQGPQLVRLTDMSDDLQPLLEELEILREPQTLAEFFDKFSRDARYADAIAGMRRMAEGFNAADPARVNALALKEEWTDENTQDAQRIEGGYRLIVNHLHSLCLERGVVFRFGTAVRTIAWRHGQAVIETAEGEMVHAAKVAVTVSSGVLAAIDQPGAIRFEPEVPGLRQALAKMGYGAVVKVVLEFRAPFWISGSIVKRKPSAPPAFIFTEGEILVWWTSQPHLPLLTGWAGGPQADALRGQSEEAVVSMALKVLARVFDCSAEDLRAELVAAQAADWGSDPFFRGAYSYPTIEIRAAKKSLMQPVEDTLYFCGEALAPSDMTGTVEAALESADHTFNKMKSSR